MTKYVTARVTKICERCGKPFQHWPSQPHRYCSMACRRDANKRPSKECPTCGKQFAYWASKPRNYCSKSCAGKANHNWRHSAAGLGSSQELTCEQCGHLFRRKQSQIDKTKHQFCSQRCFGDWLSVHNRGEANPIYCRVERKCPHCHKTFTAPPAWIRKGEATFCSKACRWAYWYANDLFLTGENHPLWKGGKFPYYGPNWYRQARAARRRDGHACCQCGQTEAGLGRKMDVHHIQPFRTFGLEGYKEANRLQNLISLCNTCHKVVEHETGTFAK